MWSQLSVSCQTCGFRGHRQEKLLLPQNPNQHTLARRHREGTERINSQAWVTMVDADLPPKAILMRCLMVFTVKRLAGGSIENIKCRLAADCNAQRYGYGVDFHQMFSTVAKTIYSSRGPRFHCYTRFQHKIGRHTSSFLSGRCTLESLCAPYCLPRQNPNEL